MNENNDIKPLNLLEILQYVWKGKFFILALMVISALVMAIRVEFFVSETYTADGVLYIYSQFSNQAQNGESAAEGWTAAEAEKSDAVTGAAINDARTMSTTYMETLKLRSFLTEVSEEIGGVYSWQQIMRMLQVSSVNETEYIMVSVTANNPKTAYRIAECICRKAQGKFAEIFKGGEAIIVDKVIYPQYADSKGGLQKVLISTVFGGVLAALIVVMMNFFDRKIRKSEEISEKYNVSVLGETMFSEPGKKKKGKKGKAHSEADRIIDETTDFDTVETYKTIRTNIMFSVPKHENGNVIVVTSASPGEGKTTTSINLALMFAQMGVKVLLVDCDLRKPRIHRYMGLKRGAGVSNVICGYTQAEDVINRKVKENLDVITAGDIPPNPAELFENQSFADMIERLQEEYEYIFVDTPPMTVVTDAVVVMKHCTGAILVARQGVTITDLFSAAVEEAKRADVKILGAIFHDSKEKQSKHYYYQRGKYGYKYKYNYRYEDNVPSKEKRKNSNA